MEIKIQAVSNIDEAIKFVKEELGAFRHQYPRTIDYVKAVYNKYPEFFIGAYYNRVLVGVLFSYPDFDKKEVLIGELVVKKEFRRKGIGKMLILELEKICKKYNIKRIYDATTTAKDFI